MPALTFNHWNVSYSTITYFEGLLEGHPRVDSYRRSKDILFNMQLKSGATTVALLLSEYTLGEAAVYEALAQFPSVQYLVNGSNWNHYTSDAKSAARRRKIGIGTIANFLHSLDKK